MSSRPSASVCHDVDMTTRATVFDEVCDVAIACDCLPGNDGTRDRIVCTTGWPDTGMAHTACPKCGPAMAALVDEAFGAHEDRPIEAQEKR